MTRETPLKPADLHILLVLLDGPRHGYEIRKDVESETGGRVRLEIGSLYRILGRMLDAGLIEEADFDGRRRNYRLTTAGRRALKSEAERLVGVVAQLRARKLLPDSET